MESSGRGHIWVYVELRNDRLLGLGLNVLSKARQIAEGLDLSVTAVIVDDGGPIENMTDQSEPSGMISAQDAATRCVAHGADWVCVLDLPGLATPMADICASVLAEAVKAREPSIVLFALTDFSRELAARTAMLCDAGLIADCADFRLDNGAFVAQCPSWGGKVMADIAFCDNDRTGFATVQPHIARAELVRGNPGRIERITTADADLSRGPKLISSHPDHASDRQLEDAQVVVVGGAGLGSSEGFASVRQLASVLGGEVGATRPPVLQHWVEESRLIGQTGKTVRPRLLVSVATSGAVQYTAGIMEADLIVAVNRDRNAPIFQVADIGIVADCKTFLPLLTERVRRETMRELADEWRKDRGEGPAGFGARVKQLRKGQDWSIELLAEKTGQSPEFIMQVESDEVAPPVGFLLRLSRALGVDPGTFLGNKERRALRDQRTDAFVKRTQNYSYETLTPGAETEHLRAFMITIESKQTHKPVAYKHEGEEFVYVMGGELELTLGGKVHCLKPGESIRFNSDIPHKLKSLSEATTRCLVVLYTP
jgi:electron transfer flavoprotein alpha subunit/transcriptional regulator with XRE-family HTH domain